MSRRARSYSPDVPSSNAVTIEGLEPRRFLSATASPANSPATPANSNFKVYSWSDWHIPGVTPMVWAAMDSLTPEQAAATTLPQLEATPQGSRAIFLWHIGDDFTSSSLGDLVRNGFNTSHDRQWVTQYFSLLKDAGVTPDFIVMDYEGGVNYWQVSTPQVQQVMGDPSLRSHLPSALQAFTAGSFKYHSGVWPAAVTAWNNWALDESTAALRDVVAAPALAVFGKNVPMSNYGDINPTATIYDLNGWAADANSAHSVDGWSSPALYLGGSGQLYSHFADPQWANFVSNMDTLRSTLASGDQVAPWISDSAFGNTPDLWAEQLRQIRASGVNTVLLWNPEAQQGVTKKQYQADITFTSNTFQQVLAMPPASTSIANQLPQMPLNVAAVDTAGYVIDQNTRATFIPVQDQSTSPATLSADKVASDTADSITATAVPIAPVSAAPVSAAPVPAAPVPVEPAPQPTADPHPLAATPAPVYVAPALLSPAPSSTSAQDPSPDPQGVQSQLESDDPFIVGVIRRPQPAAHKLLIFHRHPSHRTT